MAKLDEAAFTAIKRQFQHLKLQGCKAAKGEDLDIVTAIVDFYSQWHRLMSFEKDVNRDALEKLAQGSQSQLQLACSKCKDNTLYDAIWRLAHLGRMVREYVSIRASNPYVKPSRALWHDYDCRRADVLAADNPPSIKQALLRYLIDNIANPLIECHHRSVIPQKILFEKEYTAVTEALSPAASAAVAGGGGCG